MAQIWLTYQELGEFFDCPALVMREQVIAERWSRRRSRDGFTRVKLPEALMRDYVGQMAAQWQTSQTPIEIERRPVMALSILHEQLPLTASGQIDHDALADNMSDALRRMLPALEPANGVASRRA